MSDSSREWGQNTDTAIEKRRADALPHNGKRLRWQCGCRQNGGVMVQQWKPGDPDIDELIDAAIRVIDAAEASVLAGFHVTIRDEVLLLRNAISRSR